MKAEHMRTTGTMTLALAGFALAAATGCSTLTPGAVPLGTPIDKVRGGIAKPSGEYDMPNGGKRLEYATGSFGKQTWMLDFDSSGKLVANSQVLSEPNFATIAPGMSADDVRIRLGRPSQVFYVPWQHLQVWNYRYFDGDCVWFQVSLTDAGKVTESGIGQDPACDGPNSRD